MTKVKIWLDKIQLTCRNAGYNHIDIIIDQCGVDFSIIPALSGFSRTIKWQSLYRGLPENIYPEEAPLLVRIELDDAQQVQWLYALAHEVSATAPLLLLGSSWPFDTLAKWLTHCIDAQHEERSGIFRFWDTRLFSYLFTHVLNDEQQDQLHRPALFWSWLDRDEEPALLYGNGAEEKKDEACKKIILTDKQFENLMCLSDAKQLLVYPLFPKDLIISKEKEFSACFEAMLAATKEGLLFNGERNEWVMKYLNGSSGKLNDDI